VEPEAKQGWCWNVSHSKRTASLGIWRMLTELQQVLKGVIVRRPNWGPEEDIG
jgi:hypothetical protein